MEQPSFMTPLRNAHTSAADQGVAPLTQQQRQSLIHPDDRGAMQTLCALPVVKKLTVEGAALTLEKFFRVQTLAYNVKLGPKQRPECYDSLRRLCEAFGLQQIPELYMESSAIPCANVFGAHNYYIVVSSALLERFTNEQIEFALARQIGHIIAEHPIYKMMLNAMSYGVSWLPFKLDRALEIPFNAWLRSSELTADRVALAWQGNLDKAIENLLVLECATSGDGIVPSVEGYKSQLQEYQQLLNDAKTEKYFKTFDELVSSTPNLATRTLELMKWSEATTFSSVSRALGRYAPTCPKCGAPMRPNSRVCINGCFV